MSFFYRNRRHSPSNIAKQAVPNTETPHGEVSVHDVLGLRECPVLPMEVPTFHSGIYLSMNHRITKAETAPPSPRSHRRPPRDWTI